MKIALLPLASLVSSVGAFAPSIASSRPITTTAGNPSTILRSTTTAEPETPFFASEEVNSSGESIYEKIGFAQENVALGIDPEEVYEYLGGRDELITKFKADVPKFDDARAALEVDKFMLDAEMVNAVIKYQKRRREGNVSAGGGGGEYEPDRVSEVATYALFIGGGVGIAEVKSAFIDHTQSIPFEHFFHSVADKAEVMAGVTDTFVSPAAVQMSVEGAAAALN
mmetsp:Transcript_18112/g.39222  ORF Transcript_18112/g.39222 Transcript_18112/m.39222 type:complete len:225 (-) Transcript_18112:100-774(-)